MSPQPLSPTPWVVMQRCRRRPTASAIAVLLAIALVMLSAPAVQAQGQAARTVVRPVELPDDFDGGPVLVQFRSGGLLDSPDRGLGVFNADDDAIAFRLLGHEPEGVTSIAIDVPEGERDVYVHYSAGTIRGAQRDDDIPISLIMRTYPLRQASFSGPGDLRRAVDDATPLGVARIDRILFGHNPFGEDRQFITDIQGLLRVREATTFRLFSNHDTAAFVIINGETVIAGTEPFTERDYHDVDEQAVEITLEAGEHSLRYLHVATDDAPHLGLGMMEERRARPVRERYFVQHPEATLGPPRTEDDNGRPVVGFDAEQREQMGHEDYVFTRFALQPLAPPPEGLRYRWDLGDTTRREQADAERFDHVFPGPPEALPEVADERGWRVRLELVDDRGRALGEATSRLRPAVFGHTEHAGNERLLERYAAAIAEPDYRRTPADALMAFYLLLAETEQPALIAPIAEAFVDRFDSQRGEDVWQMKHALATHLAEREPRRAAELFGELARTADDSWRGTTAAAEQLDLMIFHQQNTDLEEVRRVVARMYANRAPRERALLQSRVGDALRVAGRFDDARRAYEDAQRARGREIEPREAAVRQRAYRETALSMLHQRRYPALRDQLLQWEADFPLAKLEGDLVLLIGRYFEAVGDHRRAATEYRTLLEMHPMHPRRPELAYRLGASLMRRGEVEAARRWLEEVVEQFPNSPFADDAQRALR